MEPRASSTGLASTCLSTGFNSTPGDRSALGDEATLGLRFNSYYISLLLTFDAIVTIEISRHAIKCNKCTLLSFKFTHDVSRFMEKEKKKKKLR